MHWNEKVVRRKPPPPPSGQGWRRVRRRSGSGRLRQNMPHPKERLLIPPLSPTTGALHTRTHTCMCQYSDPMCVAVCMLTPKHLYPLGFFNPKDQIQSRDW